MNAEAGSAPASVSRPSGLQPPWPVDARTFLDRLLAEIVARLDADEPDNFDETYPPWGLQLDRATYDARRADYLAFAIANHALLFRGFALLADDASRALFMTLVLFRMLGHERVRLPTNDASFWECKRRALAWPSTACTLASLGSEETKQLRHFEFGEGARAVAVDCMRANFLFTFLLRQYHLERGAIVVRPLPGDHVLDVGACFGDTAVDFAHAVGAEGCVHAFEIVDTHLEVIAHNAAQSTAHGRIVVHPLALSDHAQEGTLAHTAFDPGFSVANQAFRLPMQRLDDLVATGVIPQVDFIKMDIEGHELPALRGAELTLRRFRPRLAISLYHRWDDYFRIPIYLDELGLGYRFHLENYTISDGETVLYCIA